MSLRTYFFILVAASTVLSLILVITSLTWYSVYLLPEETLEGGALGSRHTGESVVRKLAKFICMVISHH